MINDVNKPITQETKKMSKDTKIVKPSVVVTGKLSIEEYNDKKELNAFRVEAGQAPKYDLSKAEVNYGDLPTQFLNAVHADAGNNALVDFINEYGRTFFFQDMNGNDAVIRINGAKVSKD
tara:strand:+ start:175 stop:534 length:360 start_codon:yes stop_codon:yes gene_type:complete